MVLEERKKTRIANRNQLTRKEKEVMQLNIKKIGQLAEQQTQIEFEKEKKEKR